MKSLYCVWNNDELIHVVGQKPAKVILIETTWDKVQSIKRTNVRKFLPNHEKQAKMFASDKCDEILLLNCQSD